MCSSDLLLGVLKDIDTQLAQLLMIHGIDVSPVVGIDFIRTQLDGLTLRVQHPSQPREAEEALLIQGKAPCAGIDHTVVPLDSEEALPYDTKVQGNLCGLRDTLVMADINLAVGPDIALSPDLLVDLLPVAHLVVNHIVEGGRSIAALLKACGRDIHQVKIGRASCRERVSLR